uniref:Uncharacterized protein n=1 Tax=Pseudomonas fluorescens TaxID=294 RepID=A0A5E6SVV7_PSEFL|nr:hypothetical protein PS652_02317 [Pseudomonas fluorescens]
MATIAAEHVLQDFFAAIVFEVDVDVRRLVALAGQKALEQQVAFHRVKLGDAQHITHHRIGRRAAPLAENALPAGKVDDVVDSEKVAFVVELGNQFQLMLQGLPGLVTDAFGPTPALALRAQVTQPGAGRLALGHQFAGVLVAQLAQIELTTRGNAQAFFKQCRRVQLGQLRQRAQVPLAIGKQALAGLGNAAVMANGSHAVLQGAAATGMHVHIATGHGRDVEGSGQAQQLLQAPWVIRAAVQLDCQPQPLGEYLAQPAAAGLVRLGAVRHPQRQQAVRELGEVFAQQLVLTLLRPSPSDGDELAQVLVTRKVLRQQHQLGAVVQTHFAADDQRQLRRLGRLPGADDPGQGALVGDRQGLVAMLAGALEQLLGTGGAALEAEVGQAMQLGITRRVHANQPCSHNRPSSPRVR